MNTNDNQKEKEISLIDAVGLLQQQVKALVKVIKQHDDIINDIRNCQILLLNQMKSFRDYFNANR